MDFSWSKNQIELRKAMIRLGSEKLSEGIVERDKKGEFFRAGWNRCADFGLQGMMVPEKYGGLGLSLFDVVSILEGAGYGCKDNGLMFSINAHVWGCEMPLLHFGTEQQKNLYLPQLCRGACIGANAMTEPDSGSDVYALTTSAIKDNDGYILNGTKTFVTNAPLADIFIVYGRTAKTAGFAGISCFLVNKDERGLIVGSSIDKMGLRTSPMAEVIFEECRIPKENLIGQEGSGAIIFNDSMAWERLFILTNALGIMERLLKKCTDYAKARSVGRKPISRHSSVADILIRMKLRLETSRLLLYNAVSAKEGNIFSAMQAGLVKTYVSETYIKTCQDAMHIFGGYGYMTEYEVERELRDALASMSYSGTSEIQKNIIAASMDL